MPLHLVVDGYNLIRCSLSMTTPEAQGMDLGRGALLERLAAYKLLKPMPITVVFDAGSGPRLAGERTRIKGIRVRFSPQGRTADQVIAEMTREMGAQALVITSDSGLGARVRANGAAVLSSQEFETRMEQAYFMEVKGIQGVIEDDDREGRLCTKKKGPAHRRPKEKRKRLKLLKKL